MPVEKFPPAIRNRIFSETPAMPKMHAARPLGTLPDRGPAMPGFPNMRAAQRIRREKRMIARCAALAAERKDRP